MKRLVIRHIGSSGIFRRCLCIAVAGGVAFGTAPMLAGAIPQRAYADNEVYTATALVSKSSLPAVEMELLEADFAAAKTDALRYNVKAAAIQVRANDLEAKIPVQQERSDAALRELYKLQKRKYDVLDMLLDSKSLDDLIQQTEYIESVSRSNLRTINDLSDLQHQLEEVRANLEGVKAEANERVASAATALQAARAERVEKHRLGVESSQEQAVTLGGDGSAGKDADGNAQAEDFNIAASTDTGVLDDGANWEMTEEEFIAEWAPRIDNYLYGSPLYGQGANFARSAWRHCIDPRWSAAISNTESSKGRICIRPYNAWGWGAADSDPYNLASEWGSWEEAIEAHATGLEKGYGYTISIRGAMSYCPYTWQSWYNNTLNEMAKI